MWMVRAIFLPEMVHWVWAAGPLLNTHRVVAKPLLCCLGCGKPWPSLRLQALWARPSLKILLNSAVFNFPSTLPSALVAATEKHPRSVSCHHHASPVEWCWAGDKQGLVSSIHNLQNNSLILVLFEKGIFNWITISRFPSLCCTSL